MRCDGCKNWTTARITRYGDGSEIANWRAPEGKGRCGVLDVDTDTDFGCNKFSVGVTHIDYNWKNGAPWQHWEPGPCPDCRGLGSAGGGACHRCAGVGKVQYHDDGYISENQTKIHPNERPIVEPLRCRTCRTEITDIKWIACPMCGTKLEPVSEPEYVGLGNSGGEFVKNSGDRASRLKMDIEQMNDRDARLTSLRRMTVENGCTEAEVAVVSEMIDRLEAI